MDWNFDNVEDGPKIIKGWLTLWLSFEFPCSYLIEKSVCLHGTFSPQAEQLECFLLFLMLTFFFLKRKMHLVDYSLT